MRLHKVFYRVNPRRIFRCLKTVKVVHVMHNDRFNRAFIDLIRGQFDPAEHIFIFYGGYSEAEFKIPDYDNVIALHDTAQFYILDLFLRKAQKIIFHGFFVPRMISFISRRPRVLARSHWIIWGGDLYSDQNQTNTGAFQVKKSVVQKLKGLVVVSPGDFEIARDLYGFQGIHHWGPYKNPIERESLDRHGTRARAGSGTTVQINNSSDASISGALEMLGAFKSKPLRVRVILSYGNKEIVPGIIESGRRVFGGNFQPVTDYMSPDKYAELLADTDVAVMNHPRQQGLGNIYAFLYLGTKVYVRSDVSTWRHLRDNGFEVFDTLKISGESFEEFTGFDEKARARNRQEAARLFDEKYLAGKWQELFAS